MVHTLSIIPDTANFTDVVPEGYSKILEAVQSADQTRPSPISKYVPRNLRESISGEGLSQKAKQ